MHQCDAILIDMDGTLVDSTAFGARLWRRFASRWDVDGDEVVEFAHGRPTSATVSAYAPAEALEAELEVLERDELDGDGVVPIAGAVALVASLDGFPWALVTSATRAVAQHRMRSAGLPLPTVLVGSDDVEHGKPDPEPFLRAAEALGVDPSRCVVLEDSPAGLAAAAAAGMRAIQVGEHEPAVDGVLVQLPDLTGLTVELGEESGAILRWSTA
ncbi:hypothetical protein ASD11_17255 [Aeromicrobium sp. Root495]|uniref:HAD-IA family hydrolase n=1 Tax=Aeromicrobium sp. Root495 TaxID=1736550 RepID=UPI0006F9DCBB|nr:HAD-IA family hydrolase [Aeromicrobium sp. Root495]KQY55300.1 hypothetical protein ASD11_17255 [Aeromicrobium sp. Root495]